MAHAKSQKVTYADPLKVGPKRYGMDFENHDASSLVRRLGLIVCLAALLPLSVWTQSSNATISGTVTDQTGAAIPGAEVALSATVSGAVTKVITKEDGLFSFPNLLQGSYEIRASSKTFRDFIQ